MTHEDRLREKETILRFDETDDPAILWTTSNTVRRQWQSFGFEVNESRRGGWTAQVPKSRITYLVHKGSPRESSRIESESLGNLAGNAGLAGNPAEQGRG